MRLASRIAASAAAAVALLASGLFLTAPAAQATAYDCEAYLDEHGYYGGAIPLACASGELSPTACAAALYALAIPSDIMLEACDRAARP
ncbi:hypothetical protein [Streptomyces sp. 6N223]|uniref:hypothetical protein n=1 Tax=Streptomyces sp. 6N223 TaxID=3457412 RepID=UPI003FD093A1